MKYCPECGGKLKETSKFCPGCGYELKIFQKGHKREEESDEEKNKEEDENETWGCEHCGKNFTNETACLRHEKNCYNKTSQHNQSSRHDVVLHQKSNVGAVIVIIIIIVIAAIILMNMYGQQQHASSFAGQTESLIDKIFG